MLLAIGHQAAVVDGQTRNHCGFPQPHRLIFQPVQGKREIRRLAGPDAEVLTAGIPPWVSSPSMWVAHSFCCVMAVSVSSVKTSTITPTRCSAIDGMGRSLASSDLRVGFHCNCGLSHSLQLQFSQLYFSVLCFHFALNGGHHVGQAFLGFVLICGGCDF